MQEKRQILTSAPLRRSETDISFGTIPALVKLACPHRRARGRGSQTVDPDQVHRAAFKVGFDEHIGTLKGRGCWLINGEQYCLNPKILRRFPGKTRGKWSLTAAT